MNKKIILIFILLLTVFLSAEADNDTHDKVCSLVWKISSIEIEIEGYVYSDTSLGESTHIQLYNNGRCVLRIIEYADYNSTTPVKKIDLSKGAIDHAVTDYTFNSNDNTLIINPSAPDERWVWKIIEATDNKIIFTSDMLINGKVSQYTFTLAPLIGCRSLE